MMARCSVPVTVALCAFVILIVAVTTVVVFMPVYFNGLDAVHHTTEVLGAATAASVAKDTRSYFEVPTSLTTLIATEHDTPESLSDMQHFIDKMCLYIHKERNTVSLISVALEDGEYANCNIISGEMEQKVRKQETETQWRRDVRIEVVNDVPKVVVTSDYEDLGQRYDHRSGPSTRMPSARPAGRTRTSRLRGGRSRRWARRCGLRTARASVCSRSGCSTTR